jgi:hypothetical protein
MPHPLDIQKSLISEPIGRHASNDGDNCVNDLFYRFASELLDINNFSDCASEPTAVTLC